MRIAVFIDYWNFQLTANEKVSKKSGVPDTRVLIDWKNCSTVLIDEACKLLQVERSSVSYEGTFIYTSFNAKTEEGKKFKNWATTWLDRQPGINVNITERKPKFAPKCPSCHKEVSECPYCQGAMVGTVEKGVDTLIVTDLIRLGLQGTYDAAVLVSSDADMVPAVAYMQTVGKKIIQAGFPPQGIDLATECWGSFDLMQRITDIERTKK